MSNRSHTLSLWDWRNVGCFSGDRWEVGRQVYGDEMFSESGLSEHPCGLVPGKLGTQRSWNVVLNCSQGEETTSKGWGGGAEKGLQGNWEAGTEMAWLLFFFCPHLNRGSCVLKSPLAPSPRDRGGGDPGSGGVSGSGVRQEAGSTSHFTRELDGGE